MKMKILIQYNCFITFVQIQFYFNFYIDNTNLIH